MPLGVFIRIGLYLEMGYNSSPFLSIIPVILQFIIILSIGTLDISVAPFYYLTKQLTASEGTISDSWLTDEKIISEHIKDLEKTHDVMKSARNYMFVSFFLFCILALF